MATLPQEKINLIEAKASDLLSSIRASDGSVQLPVDLGKVAESLNVNLMTGEFDNPDAIGYLNKKDRIIYVSDNMPAPRTAFTIAHELGHYILHERENDVYWRLQNLNLDVQDDVEETEANWFAASLLMPKSEISKWWKVTKDIEKMSQIFGVSRTAMTYRLEHLNLI